MDIVSLLTTLVGGAIGGNVAGPATQDKNLGVLGNTIAGLVGGAAGTYIMQAMGVISALSSGSTTEAVNTLASMDWNSILAHLGVSAGSGAVVTAIIAYVKDAMGKK
ncbi:MAG: hypothetical protein JSR37_05755 [Verrucomicrobia bacterium]|nr:hypothetical protein [Verrucomicrobiota bacterium]MBS0636868.1 hypothetical protein [Verrucomicrobiota bacterium]